MQRAVTCPRPADSDDGGSREPLRLPAHLRRPGPRESAPFRSRSCARASGSTRIPCRRGHDDRSPRTSRWTASDCTPGRSARVASSQGVRLPHLEAARHSKLASVPGIPGLRCTSGTECHGASRASASPDSRSANSPKTVATLPRRPADSRVSKASMSFEWTGAVQTVCFSYMLEDLGSRSGSAVGLIR